MDRERWQAGNQNEDSAAAEARDRMRARMEWLREQYDEQWQSDRDAARGGYAVSPETGTIWAANPNGSSWVPYMQNSNNISRSATHFLGHSHSMSA